MLNNLKLTPTFGLQSQVRVAMGEAPVPPERCHQAHYNNHHYNNRRPIGCEAQTEGGRGKQTPGTQRDRHKNQGGRNNGGTKEEIVGICAHIYAFAHVSNVVCVFGMCFESDWDALIGDITVVSCCIVCFLRKNGV